jgi:hypothetical protein
MWGKEEVKDFISDVIDTMKFIPYVLFLAAILIVCIVTLPLTLLVAKLYDLWRFICELV